MNLKPKFFEKKDKNFRYPHEEKDTPEQLATQLSVMLPTLRHKDICIVCIGTDRSTGDSLGPLVGTMLDNYSPSLFHIYGTLDAPVHAVNLEEKLNEIKRKHNSPFIVGIDACLGRVKSVGHISLGDGPVKPGAGVNKELPPVGDIHITGIVNVSGFMEFLVLQNTRLNIVMKMATSISKGLHLAEQKLVQKQTISELKWKTKSLKNLS